MSDNPSKPGAGKVIAVAAIVLAVLHHDFWFWDSNTLMFGFMPIGLFYHTLYSLAAGALWWCAVRCAWPTHIEEWADEFEQRGTPAGAPSSDGEGGR